jgi:hypothetical protein
MAEQEIIPAGAPIGRPSKRSPQIVDEICERLSHGEPLTKICRDSHMPSFRTVFRWEEEDEAFRHLSARARENGTHYLAHESIEIADDPVLKADDKRVRIDTRIRLIGKWNAKSYGDKVQVESQNRTLNMGIPADATAEAAALAYEKLVKGE